MTNPMNIQVHCTVAQGKALYSVYMLWEDLLPPDRRKHTGGYTKIFNAASGETSPNLCSLVWLMIPSEHYEMELGPDRLRDRELWESRARVVEEKIIQKAFPHANDLTIMGPYFQMDWPWIPPNIRERHLPIGPYSTSILLFQYPEGGYQCFLPDSTWLAQHKSLECLSRYYSSAQGVDLTLVWGATFLSHQYAGVQV